MVCSPTIVRTGPRMRSSKLTRQGSRGVNFAETSQDCRVDPPFTHHLLGKRLWELQVAGHIKSSGLPEAAGDSKYHRAQAHCEQHAIPRHRPAPIKLCTQGRDTAVILSGSFTFKAAARREVANSRARPSRDGQRRMKVGRRGRMRRGRPMSGRSTGGAGTEGAEHAPFRLASSCRCPKCPASSSNGYRGHVLG